MIFAGGKLSFALPGATNVILPLFEYNGNFGNVAGR
jgi:hypothetical protein